MTINGSTGLISAPTINATSLQENGVDIDTLFVARPCFGVYIVTTGTVSNSVGQKTVSCNKTGTGVYNLSWAGSHPSGSNYLINATIRQGGGIGGYIVFNSITSTSLTVNTFNTSGVATDMAFNIFSYP